MASESILQELFQVAKACSSFKGMSEADIQKACLAYADRSDEDIRIAIENIQKKDWEGAEKLEQQKNNLAKGREKMQALRAEEENARQNDTQSAEAVLADLFIS